MRTHVGLMALAIFVACSTPSSVAPISVPLSYKMMASAGEFPTLPPCAALSGVQVRDARSDTTIGKRFVEGKSAASAPVTTTSDVAAWVRSGAQEALRRGGAKVGDLNAPALHLNLEQISTSENVLHRSGYEGRIVINAELVGRNGSACWKDRVDGFSENYGYSGSAENYQETLNHALDRAMIHLMNAPELRRAICSCGS